MNLDYKQLPEHSKIILFDGVCNLCNGAIQFVIKRDKKNQFRYTSLQGELGKKLLKERNIDPAKIDSIILIDPNTAFYVKSTAALQISKGLSGLWPLLSVFLILPASLSNLVYDFIAKNRYKWFGKEENCMVPTKEQRELFL